MTAIGTLFRGVRRHRCQRGPKHARLRRRFVERVIAVQIGGDLLVGSSPHELRSLMNIPLMAGVSGPRHRLPLLGIRDNLVGQWRTRG